MLGLLYPTKGHIEVFGHSPRHVATKSRIGYLPEESYLYRYLNSRETLDFFGNLFRLPRNDRKDRAEQLLEMVGLSQTRMRAVGEFSKGMQRRIGLAQALINDPDLVILDEPTSGLDPIGCREVKDLIVALARRGKTVILSSHLLADVEDVCDRVVIYYGGKVQAMGTLKELLATPDAIRITTPALPRETMERVLAIIRKDVAEDKVSIDTPTQNLEQLLPRRGAERAAGRGGDLRRHVRRPRRRLLARRGGSQTCVRQDSGAARRAASRRAGAGPRARRRWTRVSQQKLEALTKPAEPVAPAPAAAPAAARPASEAGTAQGRREAGVAGEEAEWMTAERFDSCNLCLPSPG